MLQSYIKFWNEAESPLDYVINIWVTALGLIALTGFGKVLFELITNPSQFSNITFGIFDTLG
tara:strand:- start:692 stop:877 length:186 start_codon:yes stop_codon:yes gene_type:complete